MTELQVHDTTMRTRYRLMAAAWLALVVYGSLVPLNFQVALPQDGGGLMRGLWQWITSPRWMTGVDDVSSLGNQTTSTVSMLNLFLYLPAAMFLRLALWRRRWNVRWQLLAAIAIPAGFSWLLECTQSWLPMRHATLNDVFANVLGAAIGAVIAVRLRQAAKAVTFGLYALLSPHLYDLRLQLVRLRRRPILMLLIVLGAGGLLTYAAMALSQGDGHGQVNWMPFARHVKRSYDVATLQIARSLALYTAMVGLLALALPIKGCRSRIALVVLLVTMAATARELLTGGASNAVLDVTEPVLALLAAAAVFSTAFLCFRVVRSMCQRRAQAPVAHDRRRRPHVYAGASTTL